MRSPRSELGRSVSAPESPARAGEPRFGALSRLLTRIGGDALGRRIARGVLLAFVINMLSIVLALLVQAILARNLGVEGYGVFAYVMGWVNLLVVPAVFGFGAGQLRYIASYRAIEDWASMRGVRRFAAQVVIAAGIACTLMAMLVVWLLSDRLDPVLARTFYVGLLMVPVLALMRTHSSTVRALGGVVAALAPDRVTRQLTLLIGVGGLALLLPTTLGPELAMLVALAAAGLALVLVSYSQARMWPVPARAVIPTWRRREWLLTAMPLLLFATIDVVNGQAGLLLLGWLGNTTEAGIYAIASRLAGFVTFPLSLVTFVFAPNIAHLYARNEHGQLQRMATTTSWWVTIGVVMIALPLFVFPGLFLSLFGEAFGVGAPVLRILLVGAVVNALTGPVAQLMTMTGLERQASMLMVITMALTVTLNVALIPWFGMTGAALTGTVTGSFSNLAAVVIVWRRRGILSGVFGVVRR
jgi:O-antigen/teichoic acid export membrane protein